MGTNTGIGIGIGIPFKNNALGGDKPYLPPELKAKLIGVWDNYGKKNTDADRNIIKNKIPNAGGDLEILNAAYEGMSGYNGYPVVFGANKTWDQMSTGTFTWNIEDNKLHITKALIAGNGLLFSYVKLNGSLLNVKEIPSFKIKVSGLEGKSKLWYRYLKTEDAISETIAVLENGTHELPKSYIPSDSLHDGVWVGFTVSPISEGVKEFDCDITIEVLPEYEGAFVTDGVNDMIISQKTLQEMGVTKELTIVSMIHQISFRNFVSISLTNYIRNGNTFIRNSISNIGKTGIYGYTCFNIKNVNYSASKVINNILGDKNDYIVEYKGGILSERFSVQGYIDDNGNILETSSVAHYWTFAVLGKATEDDINLIIGYFNLDRTLKADIYCNIERQGITNDNHAEFNDKLIDYSGNGRDLQLFNIGWKGESGIGRYTEEFKNNYWLVHRDQTGIIKDGNSIKVVGKLSNAYLLYHIREVSTNAFKVKITGIKDKITGIKDKIRYSYILSGKENNVYFSVDGIYDIPASESIEENKSSCGFYINDASVALDWTGLTIEIIPSNKGALCLDGVNDFGKVTGMPIYKDYTFIADRYINNNVGSVASKSVDSNQYVAFIFEVGRGNYSFNVNSTVATNLNKDRTISYLSKYSYNGENVNVGNEEDSNSLWIGTIRDNDTRFSNMAIYSLMSFPYSMSEFLIERQLKKHKLGTLYPNMVEFRPIIKSNIDILKINYWDKDLNVVKVGDYISIGSNIKTSITVLDGYKISKVSSTAFNNITIEKSNTDFIYDVIFYGIKKSPQKINLVIEQDSDYVQWNPNIKANVSKYSVTANIRKTDGTTLKLVNGQFYSTSITGNLVLDIVPPYKDSDEVTNVVIDGKSYTPTKDSSGNYYRLEIPLVFPKEINITIQEYVRYEDIVQPYPVLLRFKDENNNEISWGDKIKLGSSITRIGSFNDCNLLKDIYTVSNAKLNGSPLPSTPHVVERQMVFTCTATWIFDNNEPKCILSPDRLQIPNSSYRILGYIPDISGHGNHGKINNSAYAGMSGVNGYPYDYKNGFMAYNNCRLVDSETFNVIFISPTVNIIKNTPTYKGKIKVTGLSGYLKLRIYPKDDSTNAIEILEDGVYDINIDNETDNVYFHVIKIKEGSNDINVIIQQVGEYEGAFYLDGVDDFVTIPTLVTKQSLIKCNWTTQNYNKFLVDYRKDNASNAYSTNKTDSTDIQLAYNGRVTYIDGILNKNLIPDDNLKEITHCVTIQYPDNVESETTIASAFDLRGYMQMALYTYIAFSEISTDDKIKELNTYIGITPKVTLPNYYWDNYGKKNTDANRDYIDEQVSLQKTGTSVNPLENFNIGYEGMSGYNGYPVVFGANKTWETSNAVDYIYDINSTIVHITNVKHAANGLLYSYVKRDGALANIKEIPAFRVTIKGLEGNSKLIYKYLATENATKESIVYLGNGIHKLPKSFVPTDALLDLTTNSWIGFAITPIIEGELVFDCDITIEILPEYENGLAYDGVSDFTDNKNIPIFTDFTAIIKRVDLDAKNDNSTVMFKGNKIYESGIGNGFILDYCYNSKNYVYSYGKLNQIERDDSKIIYLTPESYNGNPIIKGENEDNLGLVLGKYWKGIIYKTILYSKTISLLEINFLKNLMEKDEIIDINHPIFISNTENESNTLQDT